MQKPAAPAVAFDDVTFTYNGAGAPSLTNVSFTAKPGETIGVIGGTGSGKSTLIDLVCRFMMQRPARCRCLATM